jgi:hypothetical protein
MNMVVDERWSYNEFLAFLLIYIANVDIEFTEDEKALIRNCTGEATFDKMLIEFENMSDYKAYETILSYKSVYFPTPTEKQSIMEKMLEVCNVDDALNVMEKEIIHFMDRMM